MNTHHKSRGIPVAFFLLLIASTGLFAASELIPFEGSWKCFDGDEPPKDWQKIEFDDASWPVKKAPLMIGDKAPRGMTAIKKRIASYYRVDFNLDDISESIVEIELYARVDTAQGLQAFLNGVQIASRRLPENPTPQTPSLDQGNKYVMYMNTTRGISPGLLKKGRNVLAFSMHLKNLERDKFGDKGLDIQLKALERKDNFFVAGPLVVGAHSEMATVTFESRFDGAASGKCWPKDKPDEISRAEIAKDKHVTLLHFKALKPSKEYVYSVSVDSDGEVLEYRNGAFRTAVSSHAENFVFGLWGDCRSYPEDWAKVARQMLKDDRLSFTIGTGDFVSTGSCYELWNDDFFAPAKDFFAQKAFWPALGNHDDQAEFFFDLFPGLGTKSKGMFYTFTYGNVRFIAIDTNGTPGKCLSPKTEYKQYEFVEETLKNAREPYVFVFGHVSPFTSGYHGEWDKEKDQPKEQASRDVYLHMVPLFEKHGISAYLSSHTHMYERLARNNVNYIVSAGAGANLYDVREKSPFQVKQLTTYHYVRFTVTPEKITGEAISVGSKNAKAKIKEDGVIFDTFEIKPRSIGK